MDKYTENSLSGGNVNAFNSKPAAENTAQKSAQDFLQKYKRLSMILTFTVIFGAIAIGVLGMEVYSLKKAIGNMDNTFSDSVDNDRKIYVFDLDGAIEGIGLHEISHKFEKDIYDLDEQVKEAQETIKDIKEEEVKNKVMNLSVKPLQMKRDELLEAYTKETQGALNNINKALAQIAAEDNIPTIFINKSVAVNTNYVIDVTDRVIAIIRQSADAQ